MSQERWKQVEEIFQTALDLDADERGRFIAEVCTTDDKLRQEVEALIAQYEEAGDFIEAPALAENRFPSGMTTLVDNLLQPVEEDPMAGRRIGNYAIVREIGRGGMGAVYLAARADSIFQKQVAIKLVKRGMDTDFILSRFRNERQILATLDHPHIGRLLDGGTTEDGLPYFVMEYIEGQPVHHYCDMQRLSVRERLHLFSQICSAVAYAHKNFVIHRDIKPSNILVTCEGVPKLLDFGIAKLLNSDLASDTAAQTATAMRLMTPEYASPEQASGGRVTHASDIYSLGVLLYELVTGHRPYSLRHRAPHEIARVICEEAPAFPSHVVTLPEALLWPHAPEGEVSPFEFVSSSRRTTLENLRREISGSLDNIIMKALQKEPSERYATVEQLSEDLARYLGGQAVLAPSFQPGVTNPVRQAATESNTGEKSIAVLPLKLLHPPSAGETGEDYLRIGLADALITRLSALRRFTLRPTSSVLRYSAPDTDPIEAGRELGVGYVIEGLIRRAGDRVRITMQLLDVEGGAAVWAGQFDEKFTDVLSLEDAISEQVAGALVPQLTGGERQRLAKRGTDDAEAHAAYLRGRYHWYSMTEDGFVKAINCFERAVALDPEYAAPYAGIAEYHCWLAVYSLAHPAPSLEAARAAARKAIRLDDTLADAHTAHGVALLTDGSMWEAAGESFRRALELNPSYTPAMLHYACQLAMEGRFEEALTEARRACQLDPLNPFNSYILAWCLYQARRYEEGIGVARALLQSEPHYGSASFALSWMQRRLGNFDEATAAVEHAIATLGELPMLATTRAAIHAEAGRAEEARRILAELKEQSSARFISPYHRALAHVRLGKTDEALSLLEECVAVSDPWQVWLGVEPQLDPLRREPRFLALLQKTKNPLAARHVEAAAESVKEKSIAVLPVKLLGKAPSSDTGDEYLGIGLADSLITRLSNVRSLNVRPTSAILRYGQEGTDPLAAGRALGVEFILDGRLQQAGARIRISLQLLDVPSGASVWAHQFDESFCDVLSLEDAITRQVAEALVPYLTGEEQTRLAKRGTDNPEAFEAYLRGRYYWNTFTEEGFAKALICYNRAVAHAPDYALAYVGISEYYTFLGVYAVLPFAETSAAAKDAALKAVALDDQLAEAYSALGMATLFHDFAWEAAERHLMHALELNPNYAIGRSWYCYFLGMAGRFEEALAEVRRALELDPLTPIIQHALNWTYYYARQHEESIAATRGLIAKEPQYGLAHIFHCLVLWHAGRYREAIEAGERAITLLGRSPYTLVWLASAYAAAGQREKTSELLAEIEEMSAARYVSPYLLAMVYSNLGDAERALTELERALEIRDARLMWLGVDPQFDSLRSSERFAALLEQTGNPLTA